MKTQIKKVRLDYNRLWRWHFYAGLFCIPFAIWLSVTGTIYLFKPQIEALIDQPYSNLEISGPTRLPSEHVNAALHAIPGGVLNAYVLPQSPHSAIQILVGKDKELYRVYVQPETNEILNAEPEDQRLMQLVFHLHGDLLLGEKGSILMELAASWMIVLIVTGLYLWWPRKAEKLAGVFYPRLNQCGRVFWRDIHAVSGLWVSLFLLFLLISGLPWTSFWGGLLKEIRKPATQTVLQQDWTVGRKDELNIRQDQNSQSVAITTKSATDGHEGHGAAGYYLETNYRPLDKMVPIVASLSLAPPVLILPPSIKTPIWTAKSDAQNRPLRVNLKLDTETGEITERKDFAQRPLLDRIIGYGVAAHEGQLFGWFNQALGLFTTVCVTVLAVSSSVLWWKRRPVGTLGAPMISKYRPQIPFWLVGVVLILSLLLPLLGISLAIIWILEVVILARFKVTRQFLGL